MEGLRSGELRKAAPVILGLKQHVLNATAKLLPAGGSKFDRPSQTRKGRAITTSIAV